MAYSSTESGRFEVYIRPISQNSANGGPGIGKWQVSSAGGTYPEWSSTSKEIFFRSPENQIMAAPYTISGDTFVPGKPRVWSTVHIAEIGTSRNYDVHPDGKRILALLPAESKGDSHVTVLLNFFDELKRKVK